MALFTQSSSPGIQVKEIDLTGVVPAVTTSTGAFVGEFNWGPVEEPILVDNEGTLVQRFAAPNTTNNVDFLSAASFLKYSTSLYVVRALDDDAGTGAKNAYAEAGTRSDSDKPLIKTEEAFDDQLSALGANDSAGQHTFIARYPGTSGDALKVSVCPADDSDGAVFTAWAYRSEFDARPTTSSYASNAGGANDELHVVVIDRTGELTGTANTVLERFPFLSFATDAKTNDGTSNYWRDVINNRSEYIYAISANKQSDTSDTQFVEDQTAYGSGIGQNFILADPITKDFTFDNGSNGGSVGNSEYLRGYDKFESTEDIQIDFLIAPDNSVKSDHVTVVNDLVSTAASLRKDCVVVTSPNRAAVVGNAATSIVTDTVAFADDLTASSYLIVDNNFLKVYDKYNDVYVFIPAAASTAGLMAGTDAVAAPWFSPAGNRRGNYFGVTSLAYSANKSQRDTLYKAGINPIVNLPGQGVILFGDKTKESRPSAFDRINVRRLFLAMERAISAAARNVMFEFNDEFTRAEFVNIVEPFLREIQGRRGITDFRVVCDETNNTPAVIDRNEFIASVFVKPARSINYITLNFVAVRTGVDFEEVVGTV